MSGKALDNGIAVMDDLKKFCCVNKNCPKHGIRGEDNIRVRDWYGKNNDIRLLYCLVCKKRFSERQGTPLFDSRLPKEQVVSIVEHLVEGNGLRKTGRLTKADYRTAGRYARIAGDHAEQLHDELVELSPQTKEVQFDEKWDFVKKKQKKVHRTSAYLDVDPIVLRHVSPLAPVEDEPAVEIL